MFVYLVWVPLGVWRLLIVLFGFWVGFDVVGECAVWLDRFGFGVYVTLGLFGLVFVCLCCCAFASLLSLGLLIAGWWGDC